MFLETEVLWHDLEKWNYQAQPEIYFLKIQALSGAHPSDGLLALCGTFLSFFWMTHLK